MCVRARARARVCVVEIGYNVTKGAEYFVSL
jgi:hypothetical protein